MFGWRKSLSWASMRGVANDDPMPLVPLDEDEVEELLQEMKGKRLRGEPTRTRKGVGELVQGWEHETRLFDKIPDVDTLKRHLKKAGIDPGTSSPDDGERDVIDFHALRCTLATWCAHENVSLQMAAKLMRHSDPRLTLAVYTRLTEVHKRGAVDRLRLPETVPVTVPGSLHDLAQTRTLEPGEVASEKASRPRVADPTSALVDSSATRGLMRAGVRHGLQNRWA